MSRAFTTTNDTRLTAIFPRQPKLAGTRMSPLWILLEVRMMKVVVTTGAVKLSPSTYQQQHPIYRLDALPVPQPTVTESRAVTYNENNE